MGSSGGGTKSTSTSYLPAQKKGWAQVWKSDISPFIGKGSMQYPGSVIPEFTPEQLRLIESGTAFGGAFSPTAPSDLFNLAQYTTGQAMAGQLGAAPLSQEQAEQYYKTVYEQPTITELERNIIPGVKEAYSGPGYWGGPRAKAQTETIQDVFANLGQQRGQLGWDVLSRNQQIAEAQATRQMTATGQAAALEQLPTTLNLAKMAGLADAYKFASLPYEHQAAKLAETAKKYREGKQPTDTDILNMALAMIGMQFNKTTQSTAGGGSMGGLGAAAGMALGLLLAAPTGGMSMATGALIGGGIGAGVGSQFPGF